MQVANITLALGGDDGNTIQKFFVTPSEVAMLRSIHGESAVTNIKVIGSINRNSRVERGRLVRLYGKATDGEGKHIIEVMFPGMAARMFEEFIELAMDETFFHDDSKDSAVVENTEEYLFNETVQPLSPAEAARRNPVVQQQIQEAVENDGMEDIPDDIGTGNKLFA